MAKIPQYGGGQVLPMVRPGARVRGAPSVEQAALPGRQLQQVGQGLQEAAGVAGDYASREQEKINKVRFNDAYNQALNETNRLKNEYSQMQGAEAVKGVKGVSLRDHYRGEMEKAFSGIAGELNTPDVREVFDAATGELGGKFLRGVEDWEVQQGQVYAEQVRDATVITEMDQIAANPSSLDTPARANRARDALRDKYMDAGFDGDALDQQVKTAMGKSHSVVIEQLLNENRFKEADVYFERFSGDFMEMDAKTVRAAMDDKARQWKSVDTADQLWAESGGSYGAAIKGARQEKDPELRKMIEANLNTLRIQDDAAKLDGQEAVFEKYGDLVRSGSMSVVNIPRRDRETLTQSQLNALESIESSKSKGTSTVTDPGVYAGFYELLTTGDYTAARGFIYDNADRISQSDFPSLLSKAAKKNEVIDPVEVDSARTLVQATGQTLRNLGISKPDAGEQGELLQAYDKRFKDYQRINGKAPDDDWRDKTLEEIGTKLILKKPGWFNDVNAGKKGRFRIDAAGDIPPKHVQAVIAALPLSEELPLADVEAAYSEAMARWAAEGIKPTPKMVTDMIVSLRGKPAQPAARKALGDVAPMGITGDMVDRASGALNSAAEGGASYVAERLRTAELPDRPIDRLIAAEVSRDKLEQEARDMQTKRDKDALWQRHGYTKYKGRKMTAEEIRTAQGRGSR
jgi:hypothetical protein